MQEKAGEEGKQSYNLVGTMPGMALPIGSAFIPLFGTMESMFAIYIKMPIDYRQCHPADKQQYQNSDQGCSADNT